MARVEFSSVVTSIRGKVGGSVFQRNRSGYSLKNKSTNVDSASIKQIASRGYVSQVQTAWRSLSDSGRNEWDIFANFKPVKNRNNSNVNLSGYQLFLKYNLIRLQAGYTILTSITYSQITNLDVAVSFLVDSITDFVAFVDLNFDSNYGCLLMTSSPRNYSYPVKARSYKVLIPDYITNNTLHITQVFLDTFGVLPANLSWLAYKLIIFDIAQPVIREGYYDIAQVASSA
jgi:hypothetical protein